MIITNETFFRGGALEFRRGGIDYEGVIGVTTDFKSRLYFQTVEPIEFGLRKRWYVCSFAARRSTSSHEGEFSAIKTEWQTVLLSPIGEPILDTVKDCPMTTREADIPVFIQRLGYPILLSMANGAIIAEPLGQDKYPLFNSLTGAILEYTTEQLNEVRTDTYHLDLSLLTPIEPPIEDEELGE